MQWLPPKIAQLAPLPDAWMILTLKEVPQKKAKENVLSAGQNLWLKSEAFRLAN
jgi:hypothetical protein